jgi:hypothetical protein
MSNKCVLDEIRNRKKKISLANLKDFSSRISRLNNRTKSSEDLLLNEKCQQNQSTISDYLLVNQSNISNQENCQSNSIKIDENSTSNLPYYYQNIDRDKSESILRLINRPGCFLIRKHENNSSSLISSPYVLSIIAPSFKIVHYLLYRINQNLFIKPFSREFYHSVKHLVDEHKLNPGVLPCTLLEYPIPASSNNDRSSLSSSPVSSSSSSSLIIETNKLIRQQIIGRGHFGIVYKGWIFFEKKQVK